MSNEETKAEIDRLVSEVAALPPYRGWTFTYEYPGYFCYSHPELPHSVFFTPDWERAETLDIQVQTLDGHDFPDYGDILVLPREGRSGQQLLDLVRPTLDKLLLTLAPSLPKVEIEALTQAHAAMFSTKSPASMLADALGLTKEEIDALQLTREHVRVHMAHEHPWTVRDAAMSAISKVLAAAREARS